MTEDEKTEAYVLAHSTPESELLRELTREANVRLVHPRMVSGHVQGRLLAAFVHMIKPHRVLEIGTYVGYSAICMAEGLPPGGRLITIDRDDEIEDMARSYINRCPDRDKIDFIVGDALEIIPKLDEEFQLVFIDGDKRQYQDYYDLVFDKVPAGGFILADNTLWDGHLLRPLASGDHMGRALADFNDRLAADDRVEVVMVPVRDGITVVRKRE